MTKERMILAFIAIAAGLIVASSTFYFYQQKSNKTSTGEQPASTIPPSNGKVILEIESPENESITDEKTIELKGKSLPQSLLVLSTSNDNFVFTADKNGSFIKKIALSEDENFITVTAYPENGTSETKELIVTYTTEEF